MKGKKLTVDESIRIEAYLLSEKAGHPPGMEHFFWKEAETIVSARAKVVATAVKKAADRPKVKAKPAAKKPALNSRNGKDQPLPLEEKPTAPARSRAPKK